MRLLLLSNSTNAGEKYLQHALPKIKDFTGSEKFENAVFIPYAFVGSFDEYEAKVNERLAEIGLKVKSAHRFRNAVEAVENADLIVVGGGNTFRLLYLMYKNEIISAIRKKVYDGTPYIGWSAGSNVACPTIMTTNDMPIIEPPTFRALDLVKFQINPHYTDKTIPGHGGESRDDRLKEFIDLNKNITVVALREGTALRIENKSIKLVGENKAKIFKYGQDPYELSSADDFSFLL